ncbi:MAG: hypothetical protein ACLRIS_15045 [Flavonifractor plautii]
MNLDAMTTETRNQATMNLDTMTPLEVVTAMNREDARVPQAIEPLLPSIAKAVEWAIDSWRRAGDCFTWALAPAAAWACWMPPSAPYLRRVSRPGSGAHRRRREGLHQSG